MVIESTNSSFCDYKNMLYIKNTFEFEKLIPFVFYMQSCKKI